MELARSVRPIAHAYRQGRYPVAPHLDRGAGPWYALGWNTEAHSGYWDEGNPALASMGAIVTGNGGTVR